MIRRGAATLCLFLLSAAATTAQAGDPPRFRFPVDCRLGETCWVMNYLDTDPGPGAKDFRCRGHSYEGHSGTDFAIRDQAIMQKGVAVFAAAPGTVLQARDGEKDGQWLTPARKDVVAAHRECGNRVAIDHGGGWITDNCHMLNGSIAVKAGEKVQAGQRIGLVGMSGMTEYPHVHFEVKRQRPNSTDLQSIDPFSGRGGGEGCALQGGASLWADDLPYESSSLFAAGFADRSPSASDIRNDASSPASLPSTTKTLTLWTAVLAIDAGTVVTMRIAGPDGVVLGEGRMVSDRERALSVPALPRPAPDKGWMPGLYHGTVTVTPPNGPAQSRSVSVDLR